MALKNKKEVQSKVSDDSNNISVQNSQNAFKEDNSDNESKDVKQVKDELKREEILSNFNGWLSVVTFGLLILTIFSVYIYGSSVRAKNKISFADLHSDVSQLQNKIENIGENSNVTSLSIQNASNLIHELEEKINEIEKNQISYQSKTDVAIANLKPNVVEAPLQPLDLEKYALTEAHYLIKMSFRKMYLEKDVSAAVMLLSEAKDILLRADEPNFLRLLKSISNDMVSLSKIENVDSEALILRLYALEENIKNIPVLSYKMNFNENVNSDIEQEISDNVDDWKQNAINSLTNFANKLIIVKKVNNDLERVFLDKEQINVLQDKIVLYLLQAQQAVYSQQQTVFEQSLSKVNELVETYFDKDDSVAEQVLGEINDLKSQNILFIGLQKYESLNVIQEYLMNK